MAMAIEPMLVLGDRHTILLEDDWTVVTADGSLASHFEHTVAITPDGPVVTTAEDGSVPDELPLVAAGEHYEAVAEEPSGARRP